MLQLPHPFIMTLGTLNVARGLTYLISNGAPISGLQPEVRYHRAGLLRFRRSPPPAGIPASLILVAVCAVGLWFFLEKTIRSAGTSLPSAAIRMRRASRASMSIACWSWSM